MREKRTPIFLVERFMGVHFLSFFCGCPFSVPFSALINAGRKENEERKKDTHFLLKDLWVSFFCFLFFLFYEGPFFVWWGVLFLSFFCRRPFLSSFFYPFFLFSTFFS